MKQTTILAALKGIIGEADPQAVYVVGSYPYHSLANPYPDTVLVLKDGAVDILNLAPRHYNTK
jgi:hypothetical protein